MKQRSVGDILREERMAHRISIPEMAKRTRIRQEYLTSLEENEFEKLPAATFVKGYIKIYAQIFEFDPQPVLAILRRDYKESSKGKLVSREFLSPVLKKRRTAQPVRYVAVAIVLAFATVIFYIGVQWWRMQQPPELSITAPEQFANVGPEIIVKGATSPDARLSINNQPVALQPDGSFEHVLVMPVAGLKSIEIKAINDQGKETSITRQVQVSF